MLSIITPSSTLNLPKSGTSPKSNQVKENTSFESRNDVSFINPIKTESAKATLITVVSNK